ARRAGGRWCCVWTGQGGTQIHPPPPGGLVDGHRGEGLQGSRRSTGRNQEDDGPALRAAAAAHTAQRCGVPQVHEHEPWPERG
ncbi:unnamed protein product, partial [Ectocarpus fasciculatus]